MAFISRVASVGSSRLHRLQERFQRNNLRASQTKAKLCAPPQNILCRMCPFIFNEIAHFCLIEIGTKMLSQISERTGLSEQGACPCSIKPEEATGMGG